MRCPDSGLTGPRSSPGWGHCVVFLGTTLYSHSASLLPGGKMGTGVKMLGVGRGGGGGGGGVTLWWTSIPSRLSRNTPSRFMVQKLG